ncbi:Methyltransferase type 11 [Penicillium camemberti]|uniref:Methyltransferase type 11 n=1 Tax=Penicillium camemberti (strain FM 013) TaxID=1429867 RepID=A0A0G4PM10_PENC3|nr:Methyltransferase type 11 [Penicillium camemberti]
MARQQEQKDIWSADLYGEKLDPKPTDEILDIGSGEGPLTARIAPHSRVVDCRLLDQETDLTAANFDKVFSNATLHWILRDPETRSNAIKGCFEALKPGGLLVSESGALGNVAEWFPSQQAIKELIEGAGFNWIKGEVQLRQITLTENEKGGVEGWIRLSGEPFLGLLPITEAQDAAVKHAVDILEAVGRQQYDGSFTVNYIRLRFVT